MKFSVLMSVYEKENPEYLRESLGSILSNQTVLPTEMVLVEDGPLTTELYGVIESFKQRFQHFVSVQLPSNVGLGLALQEGLKHCQYEWVARMDSDDIARPNRFERQIAYISQNDVDVVASDITEFYDDINNIVSIKKMPTSQEDIVKMSKRRTPVCHVTVMFKKAKVIEAGNYLSLPYVEDYYLWARMISKDAKFSSIPESLVFVRVGNGMFKRRGNKQQIRSWFILNSFMLRHHQINKIDFIINLFLITCFVYMPLFVKKMIYRVFLRNRN